ncbi:P-loop containing nucleoside triphosphate hydrolase protein [Crassisporium funariophilum]|nr:P-loop containing nucleoside triphosphate hydrolase protein [Crassisporium funariophilum]
MQLRSILADQRARDSLISAGTGSGKTLPIALCTLLDNPAKKKVTIIVSPLKRLQTSQANEFTAHFGIRAVAINEDTPRDPTWWSENIFSTKHGVEMHAQLLIITVEQIFRTPEGHFPRMAVTLRQPAFQSLVSRFCVDEAHSFYTAGFALYGLPAFRPAWGKLHELKALLRPSIPWHFFLATFPPHILNLVQEKLLRSGFEYIHVTSNRPNIIYATHQVENSIEDVRNYKCFLQSPFEADRQPHVLIFFDDKKLTTKVEAHLESCLPLRERGKGIVRYYHSSMSKGYLEEVHEDFISPDGTCKILIATSGESVGIDFPNVKIVCTVGLPTNIVDALQRGGRAIRTGDEQALFVVFYEPWAFEINLEEYLNANSSNVIDDPDRPRDKLKINSQRRERAPYSSVCLVQRPTCLRQFYADYLNDKLAMGNQFCCDRHNDGFDLQVFLPGILYKITGEKRKADTQADGPSAKLRTKADRMTLDGKIIEWLKNETAQDPIGRPYYHILSDNQKKTLVRIAAKDLHSPSTITTALDETDKWGTQWASKLFRLIFEHDMATKAASKARTQTAKAHRAASSGTGFINITPDTYSSTEQKTTCKKVKSN